MNCLWISLLLFSVCFVQCNSEKVLLEIDKLQQNVEETLLEIKTNYEDNDGILMGDSGQQPEITLTNTVLSIITRLNKLFNVQSNQIETYVLAIHEKLSNFSNIILLNLVRREKDSFPLERWNDTLKIFYGNLNNSFDKLNKIYQDNICQNYKSINTCTNQQFKNYLILNKYKFMAALYLKTFVMLQYTNFMQKRYNQGEVIAKLDKSFAIYKKWIQYNRRCALESLKIDRTFWKCDPTKHIKDVTSAELNVFQGYVVNELNLNEKGTCKQDCPSYNHVEKYQKCKKKYDEWCEKSHCEGNIIDCKFFNSDMNICHAYPQSKRRYENIVLSNGKYLGPISTKCSSKSTVASWTRWFVRCHYCICVCESRNKNSDRYISLRPALSDARKNMVVTGVRFVKLDKMIHLQVEEGKLLPQGEIDKKTVAWVPVKNFDMFKEGYSKMDYYSVTLTDRRVGLDEVYVNSSYLVTGVRFKVEDWNKKTETVVLEVFLTPFDFDSGKLNINGRIWKSHQGNKRSEIQLNQPDISTKTPTSSAKMSTNNQFVKFTYTSFDKDIAQTTVPFFDLGDVSTQTAVPLSGIGLIYKGLKGYGGFLSPSLFIYDFSQHIPRK